MKLTAFSVKDTLTGIYANPFFALHVGQATRGFSDAVNDSSTEFFKHPDDYELYSIGVFDPEVGVILPTEPELLTRGRDVKIRDAS